MAPLTENKLANITACKNERAGGNFTRQSYMEAVACPDRNPNLWFCFCSTLDVKWDAAGAGSPPTVSLNGASDAGGK